MASKPFRDIHKLKKAYRFDMPFFINKTSEDSIVCLEINKIKIWNYS